jgi:hypothetical protein
VGKYTGIYPPTTNKPTAARPFLPTPRKTESPAIHGMLNPWVCYWSAPQLLRYTGLFVVGRSILVDFGPLPCRSIIVLMVSQCQQLLVFTLDLLK